MIFNKEQKDISDYEKRNTNRKRTLLTATCNMIVYFMGLGDDILTAKGKVNQLSDESEWRGYQYEKGNIQPLIDCINASVLSFMDVAAKEYLIDELTPN